MQKPFDYKQFIVLWVDDATHTLGLSKRYFGDEFRILTASSANEGLHPLRQHKDEVGVLITNYRMPVHDGVWLLEQARDVKPHLVRILYSCYCHGQGLLAACRIGIHKFIFFPGDLPVLEQTLRGALEQFALVNELVGSAWQAGQ